MFGTFSKKDAPWDHFGRKTVVLKASGFQVPFWNDFGLDLEVPGTAKTKVSCGRVVKNDSLTGPKI